MFNFMLIFLVVMINFYMIIIIHPLMMTLMLIIQTILIAMISSSFLYSMWFSYILFLIFLGGMLILFMYMTSLASNELFTFSNKFIIPTMFILILFILTLNSLNIFSQNSTKFQDSMLNQNMTILMDMPYNLNQLFNFPNFFISSLLIIYLLITLIVIVKITFINQGPIRHMFN